MKIRFLALLVVLCLVLGSAVALALAAETPLEPTEETTQETVTETVKEPVEKVTVTVTNTTKKAIGRPDPIDGAGGWVIAVAALVLVVYLVTIVNLVIDGKLVEALSEESEETETTTTTDPKTGTPVTKKVENKMVLSSSRLIAFLGLIGILGMFLGTGLYTLYALFSDKPIPDLEKIASFLTVGAVIFAPYVANQLKGIFSPFKK